GPRRTLGEERPVDHRPVLEPSDARGRGADGGPAAGRGLRPPAPDNLRYDGDARGRSRDRRPGRAHHAAGGRDLEVGAPAALPSAGPGRRASFLTSYRRPWGAATILPSGSHWNSTR